MSLIEMPGNRGQIFAVDPHRVTGVNGFRSTLPGKGGQLFDMSTVWLDNRTLFVCVWKAEQVVAAVNAARQPVRDAFEAGYAAGIAAEGFSTDFLAAFEAWREAAS